MRGESHLHSIPVPTVGTAAIDLTYQKEPGLFRSDSFRFVSNSVGVLQRACQAGYQTIHR
jgi:hypothetical protein